MPVTCRQYSLPADGPQNLLRTNAPSTLELAAAHARRGVEAICRDRGPSSETKPLAATPCQLTLHDHQTRKVFQEKQLSNDELSAVYDELLALREQTITKRI